MRLLFGTANSRFSPEMDVTTTDLRSRAISRYASAAWPVPLGWVSFCAREKAGGSPSDLNAKLRLPGPFEALLDAGASGCVADSLLSLVLPGSAAFFSLLRVRATECGHHEGNRREKVKAGHFDSWVSHDVV